MNWIEKFKWIFHILRWRLSWSRRDLDYRPPGSDPDKFLSAREAAALINDHAVVFSSGIAGNARCSVFFYALRDRFRQTGHPRGLTWINAGAQGSRGRVPGTVEEIGLPGLMSAYLTGHLETAKAQLKLGAKGDLELYTLPQGIISLLLEAQGRGERDLLSDVALKTFMDPSCGTGAAVNYTAGQQFVRREGENLRYTMPQPEVALISAPYADEFGNIYFKNASTITENLPSVRSVRRHGGRVMVAVSEIIPADPQNISIPKGWVDYIVVNPYNEQTISVPQKRYWRIFTPEGRPDVHRAVDRLKFINTFLKITPVRTPVGQMIARLASSIFARVVPKGGMINIGVGFPEEVARIIVEHGREEDYIFTTEAGSYGGLPAPGIFFGAAIHPQHLESSSRMFERYHDHLDMAVLGFLQVDSDGNVNVSQRGEQVTDYVGPGGFPDIVHGAKHIIFIGNWMHPCGFVLKDGQVVMTGKGKPKFVDHVREVTFNGQRALAMGKEVYYVTDVGYFKLTDHGLQLVACFPGIRIQEDILDVSRARIYIPPGRKIPVIDPKITSGVGFEPSIPPFRLDSVLPLA
ncbi:malonate decarboxylase subunit alpha [Flavilitoribacter nigricans]|uniref:Acyl CoA:acetate/3-ketoacid CoA transferase n=1 Tax=Flavilitoribacter nigricans (strain ATCC 23147 / DSM 23189 / NBRC 102662 / NCIMB 1420 / SS-2) TaxID=1122177 RepID=A0A2D0NCK5_FLAN2|nr:malonate decarboxylase subunit alpha [Flavilitoribacter nigricans]PHN06106.1 hypothetical protein CRP01_14155 [Flavilitoribacter nigricans DSM 23189 = NBRC 102662]